MRRNLLLGVTLAALAAGCTARPVPPPSTEHEKALHVIGLELWRIVEPYSLSDEELERVVAGLRAGHAGKDAPDMDEFRRRAFPLLDQRMLARARERKRREATQVERMIAAQGAVRLASGGAVVPVVAGTGAMPLPTDFIKASFRATLLDGTVVDEVPREAPIVVVLDRAIACWSEALQKMKVGGKARVVCPPETAYGDAGRTPDIPGGAALLYDIELHSIEKQ